MLFRVTTRLRDGSDRGGSGGFVVGRIGSCLGGREFNSWNIQTFLRRICRSTIIQQEWLNIAQSFQRILFESHSYQNPSNIITAMMLLLEVRVLNFSWTSSFQLKYSRASYGLGQATKSIWFVSSGLCKFIQIQSKSESSLSRSIYAQEKPRCKYCPWPGR